MKCFVNWVHFLCRERHGCIQKKSKGSSTQVMNLNSSWSTELCVMPVTQGDKVQGFYGWAQAEWAESGSDGRAVTGHRDLPPLLQSVVFLWLNLRPWESAATDRQRRAGLPISISGRQPEGSWWCSKQTSHPVRPSAQTCSMTIGNQNTTILKPAIAVSLDF